MASEESKTARQMRYGFGAFGVLIFVFVIGMMVSFVLPRPMARKYPDRIPVRFWHMWTAEWKEVVDNICEEFNESQDKYEIIPISVPGGSAGSQADTKFLLAVAGGSPPDLMAQWNPVIPKWSESKLLIPLDDLMTPQERRYFLDNAYPVAKRISMYKGKIYGMPTGMNIWACYYLPQHFREAGLDPEQFPETLEELTRWGDRLNRFDGNGRLTRMGFYAQNWSFYAPGFGKGFYDWDKDELLIDTPGNLAALTFLADERRKLGWSNVARFQSGTTSLSGSGIDWPFITGSYSVLVDGQWRVEQLAKHAPELEYATAALPPPAGGNRLYGWSNGNFLIVPSGSKQKQGAYEFIKFWSGLAKPERAAVFETWGGWLPPFPDVVAAPAYQAYIRKYPQFRVFLDAMASENIQPVPPVPYQVFFWDKMTRIDELAMRGRVTPEQAVDQLKAETDREIARRKEFRYID